MLINLDAPGSEPNRPRYVEAYPRLSARHAFSGLISGHTHVTWYDEFGDIVGQAHVSRPDPDTLLVVAAIAARGYISGFSGGRTFPVTWHGSSPENEQPMFLCRDCGARVTSLVFGASGWSCAKCNELKNRSALIGEKVRLTEQGEELQRLIGRGRPIRMREKRYQELLARLATIRFALKGERLSASVDYRFRVTAQWAAPEPE